MRKNNTKNTCTLHENMLSYNSKRTANSEQRTATSDQSGKCGQVSKRKPSRRAMQATSN
ncbi:MAG: hypothetical protein FWB72_05990 [Firmicutes bacterium]|nr:hypothetical protein [Bacillota bacterium]